MSQYATRRKPRAVHNDDGLRIDGNLNDPEMTLRECFGKILLDAQRIAQAEGVNLTDYLCGVIGEATHAADNKPAAPEPLPDAARLQPADALGDAMQSLERAVDTTLAALYLIVQENVVNAAPIPCEAVGTLNIANIARCELRAAFRVAWCESYHTRRKIVALVEAVQLVGKAGLEASEKLQP